MKKVCVILIIVLFSISVRANNIINLKTSDDICNAVKSNKTLLIGIDSYYGQSSVILPDANACSNTKSFNNNKSKIEKDKMSFVGFGRMTKANTLQIDNVVVKEKNKYNEYAYFYISNHRKTSQISKNKTLNPGEKIFLRLNTSDKSLKSNSYKDLRLTIKYGTASSKSNITRFNSISYYVTTNKKTYGPYDYADVYYDNIYTEINASSGKTSDIIVYNLVSDNLVKNIPSGEYIKTIKILPYEKNVLYEDNFKIFSLSLDGNSKYSNNRKYTTVSNAEMITRKNIVNNMYENVTVKWDVKGQTTLSFYHHYVKNPIVLNPKDNKIYYGIPYVNNIDTTISAFTSQMTKNKITENNKKSTAYYSYSFTNKYLSDITATNGTTIKKNSNIKNNILYVYETQEKFDNYMPRKDDLNKNPYIPNKDGYYFGLDCSSATFLPNGRELPYSYTNAVSVNYYFGNEVNMLGGLSISSLKVENYLRNKKIINKNDYMTLGLMQKYFGNYMRDTYGEQKIYNSYGLLIPGDIVDTMGHVRMETGYPVVVCNDGKVFGGKNTTKYTNNLCKDHKGINPKKSYVITTEVGSSHVQRSETTSIIHLPNSETGWTYSLNKSLTDLNSIDELYDKNKGYYSIFNVNIKYTFEELYNKGDKNKIYLPFRYKEMQKISNTNKVENPNVKLVLDKNYNNPGEKIYDYLKTAKKLKGNIFSNYMIDTIKITINNKSYYIYPNQTNSFSLYNDIKDTNILNALKNMDYSKNNKITISVKTGPNIKVVKTNAGADSDGYIKVIDIVKSKTLLGDVNGDGKVNALDTIKIIKHQIKKEILKGELLKRADVNNDGVVNSLDYLRIVKIIIGLPL